MFPTTTAFLPSLDARWAGLMSSSAFGALETGFPADMATESMRLEATSRHEPLSREIARDLERKAQQDAVLDAQDPPSGDLEEAQDPRPSEADEAVGPVSISGPDEEGPGPRSLEGRPAPSRGQIYRGRRAGQGPVPGVMAKAATARPESASTTPIAATTTEAVPVSATVVRSVPAAVLRAIEVEASLELGAKGTGPLRSSTSARTGSLGGTRTLAEAELRTIQGMTSLLTQRGGRLRVHLHPTQLGPVMIDVEVEGDRVRVVIETATRGAGKVLEAATSRLRSALESQGYTLDHLEIRHQALSTGEAEDAETRGDDARREDSNRTREDGRSSRRWRPEGGLPAPDEDFNLADFGGKERVS